jgi:hypothetical protein
MFKLPRRPFKRILHLNIMPDSARLTHNVVFRPEVDISSLRLTSRIVWPVEVSPIVTSTSRVVDLYANFEGGGIPKPKGVVGRVKEGGYSLIKVLGWERGQYNEIQVGWVTNLPHTYWLIDFQAYVRMQAAVHCDTRLNYQSQSEDAVSRVCRSVCL